MTMLDVIEDQKLDTTPTDNDDGEFFAHYVLKEDIVQSAINGTPAYALCGKVWVPHRKVEGRAVCPECKDEYDKKEAD
ncbi:DUF3039 domain-containing protein [Microbacterium sp. LMI12-1-1.1]|uniref:DUF3039 domain-containing protein n=1 Tax=Microbacterium sp. LMI12-1-1.1 TaxID=3135225 RepID=UPI00343356B0